MFFPVQFSDYDDNIATMFTCPYCGVAADVVVPWQKVVRERTAIPGAKSQFGPLRYPLLFPFLKYKFKIDIPLNILAHVDIGCASCAGKVTAYFDCQAGGRHGEGFYAIAAAKVGDSYRVEGLKSPPPKRHYPEPPKFDPAGPATRYLSEVWFDASQWETAIPEGWSVRRRGAHEFSAPYGATLRFGVSLRGKIQGYDRIRLPSADMPEFEQELYRMTRHQADAFDAAGAPLERHVLGVLTGYCYRTLREDGKFVWCGHFGEGPHWIYVSLVAPPEHEAYCLAAAQFMLASVIFHPKQVGAPSLPLPAGGTT